MCNPLASKKKSNMTLTTKKFENLNLTMKSTQLKTSLKPKWLQHKVITLCLWVFISREDWGADGILVIKTWCISALWNLLMFARSWHCRKYDRKLTSDRLDLCGSPVWSAVDLFNKIKKWTVIIPKRFLKFKHLKHDIIILASPQCDSLLHHPIIRLENLTYHTAVRKTL